MLNKCLLQTRSEPSSPEWSCDRQSTCRSQEFSRLFKTHVRLFEGPAILKEFSKYFIECKPGARWTPLALQLFPGKSHSLLFLVDGPLLLLLLVFVCLFYVIIFCQIPSAPSTDQDRFHFKNYQKISPAPSTDGMPVNALPDSHRRLHFLNLLIIS